VVPERKKRVAEGVLWGYVAVAVSAVLFQAAQDYRFAKSVARARLCIAQLDSACVSRELEVEGAIRQGDARMELGAASLGLLLHRPGDQAQVVADRFERALNAGTLASSAELRADVLLLRSDVALANSDFGRARASVEAARALLGESELTALRLRRIEAAEADVTARHAKSIEGLRQSFDSLFEAAESGNRALMEVREAACSDWLGRVADTGARRSLQLALQAARRSSFGRYAEPSAGPYRASLNEPPRPPSKSSAYDYANGPGTFEERTQRYKERLARYEKEQAVLKERENLRATEASVTKEAALGQAKEALAAGVAALSAAPTPFTDALPGTKPAAVPARSFDE
jgi:hypothetical protein